MKCRCYRCDKKLSIISRSSGVKYRKIRQTNVDQPERIPANETLSRPPNDSKNETISKLNDTTPIPPPDSTSPVNVINHTNSQPAPQSTTPSTTTTDLRPEPSERVIYDNYQTSTEISVGSYYAENRNLGDFARDIRLLPAPISSSTASSYIPYRRNYASAPGPNYYPYYDNARYTPTYRDNYDRQYRTGYYPTDYRSQGWNQSGNFQTNSNQMFVMEPMNYRPPERKTIIALPPVQLPPMSTGRPFSSRRRVNVNMFKEREYRCLGQWQENNLTYTFTQRKDIGTYECFVGRVISEYEISVREAGKYCERNVSPLMLEMNFSRKSSCAENRTSTTIAFNTPITTTPTVTTTKYPANKRIIQHTTRSWRPLMNASRPQSPYRNKNGNNGCSKKVSPHLCILSVLYVVIYKFLYSTFTSS